MTSNKNDSIDKKHFLYMMIISLIIIVAIFSFYFGGGENAGRMLSFAATLSSILLAFIAILMTIVDLAGQRETISDLKETARTLSENLSDTEQSIKEIGDLKDELLNSLGALQDQNKDNAKEMSALIKKYSNTQGAAELNDLVSELEGFKNNLNENLVIALGTSNTKVSASERNRQSNKVMEKNLRGFFKNNLKVDELYEFNDIYSMAKNQNLPFSRATIKNELRKMTNNGTLELINGKYYRF